MEEPPVLDADGDAPPAKKKGSKGYPKGIIDHKSGNFQARLSYKDEKGKIVQRPIPGLFGTIPEAVAAQTEKQLLLDSGGVDAVWTNNASTERNKRGEVCHLCLFLVTQCELLCALTHCTCARVR